MVTKNVSIVLQPFLLQPDFLSPCALRDVVITQFGHYVKLALQLGALLLLLQVRRSQLKWLRQLIKIPSECLALEVSSWVDPELLEGILISSPKRSWKMLLRTETE